MRLFPILVVSSRSDVILLNLLCDIRVYVDDVDVKGQNGGMAYKSYGISPNGAVVVVRPDGYVGTVAPLEDVDAIDGYFVRFMKPVL